MSIPRRDLLTGTALILVGEKLARGGERSASTGSAPTGSAGASGKCRHLKPLHTPFMDDFTDEFIGDHKTMPQLGCDDPWPDPPNTTDPPTRKWPLKGQGREKVIEDYSTFVNVLLWTAWFPPTVPPPPQPNTALAAHIVKFLSDHKWPNGTPIPPEYTKPIAPSDERTTVVLVEIAVIQDRLLQAINSFDFKGGGAGGGGSNWPPH